MFFWLAHLPPELGVKIVHLVRIEDRDALLATLDPRAVALYLDDLRRRYPAAAVRGAETLLRVVGDRPRNLRAGARHIHPRRIVEWAETPSRETVWMQAVTHEPRNQRSRTIAAMDRFGDTLADAWLCGTDIRWIRLVVGRFGVPGSTVFYTAAPKGARRILRFTPPRFPHDRLLGVPMIAMLFWACTLQCNPEGKIHRVMGAYECFNDRERMALATADCSDAIERYIDRFDPVFPAA